MKIAAFPGLRANPNPYQKLLYTAIVKQNHIVEEFTWKNILLKKYHIIHIHWPESNKFRKNNIVGFSLFFFVF